MRGHHLPSGDNYAALIFNWVQRKFIPQRDSNSSLYELKWDDELPSEYLPKWQAWLKSLGGLHNLSVPRCFTPKGFAIGPQELYTCIRRRFGECNCVRYQSAFGVNPAEVATRPACPEALFKSYWLQGPKFLWKPGFEPDPYVNYKAVLPLPEELFTLNTMVNQCIPARFVHPLFSGNKTFNELIVLFSVVLLFKNNVIRRQHETERAGVLSADRAPYRPGMMLHSWLSAQHNATLTLTFGNC